MLKRNLAIVILTIGILIAIWLLPVGSLGNQAVSFFTQTIWPWLYKAYKIILIVAGVAFLGIICWIVDKLLQIKEWQTKKAEKEKQMTEKFRFFFEDVKDESNKYKSRSLPIDRLPFDPRLLVVKDCDAKREQMKGMQRVIERHLESSKESFHIFDVCGGPKQGKSTLLWRLATEVSKNQRTKEYWYFKEGFRFESTEKWSEFIKTLQDYFNIRQKLAIVLFWDNPYETIAPEIKPALRTYEIYDLWDELQRDLTKYLKRRTKVVLVATSSRPYPYRKLDWSFIASPEDDESKDLKVDYVTPFPLRLTKIDVQSILTLYSKLKKIPDEKLQYFLRKSGIYEKCHSNVLFLLYLFEQFINPRELRFILDDDTRRNLESYKSWNDSNNKKKIVRFIALANLLNLTVSHIILESVNVSDLDALRTNFLTDAQGEWTLTIPFLGYVLLEEEADVAQDFSTYLFNILDPWVESTVNSLVRINNYSIHRFLFIRNIIHFIEKEKYRPILSKFGHKAAKRLFVKHQAKLLSFIDEIVLPEIGKSPSLLWVIRKWASTFQRLGLWDRAEDLYDRTLQSLPRMSGKQRVKIMIALAEGLASLSQYKHKNKALEIYNELLDADRRTSKWVNCNKILALALDLFLQLKRPEDALFLMDRVNINWKRDSLLCIRRGQILENTGNLPAAESCFRRARNLSAKLMISPKTKLNSLRRYALFLIRYNHSLLPDKTRPNIEILLQALEETARIVQEHVESAYMARGEFYEKIKQNYIKALAEYKKAVDWCKDNGIPNPRPYNKLANYLVEKATLLPQSTSGYMVEAETYLETVVNGEDFDSFSKKRFYNILGRLVGGTIRSEKTLKPIPYQYEGRQRPDYDEALQYLRNSFEREDEDEHSDPNRKTWQDTQTHSVMGDILRYKAHNEDDITKKNEYLKGAKQHIKAAYEGLPREDMDGMDVRKHIINAMDNYAHIVWEIAKTNYSREVDTCRQETIDKMEEWELNSKSFPIACDVYSDYGYFLWKTKVRMYGEGFKVPHIPLLSIISDVNGKDEVMKIMDCYKKTLLVLSEERKDYGKLYIKTGEYLLISLRALVADAIHYNNNVEFVKWMEEFLETFQKILNKLNEDKLAGRDSIIKNICRFLEHKQTIKFIDSNPPLKSKLSGLGLEKWFLSLDRTNVI